MSSRIPSLSLLVLRSASLEAVSDFYSAFGFDFRQEQHGSGPLHYAAEVGGLVLEIYPLKAGQTEADDSTMLGFEVESLSGLLMELEIKAEIKSSELGRFCSVKDPDGRTVRLTEATE
ncbi:glyoxalase/bleomycin resistance/extradiol dioxygenase family protein [bacterium]|nr:MAG: glyoxalase/bleomycin resistance/extradiol dioxygenase family protein [bacterium]